ncbi:MAG TPA: ABC transporter permease [Thermoanaerobaculia bacterium]|nr:ABC transporter permease [Thermoanaerobaculia bacterium]
MRLHSILHRALLRLYPASFRAEYGDELSRIFAQRRRDASGVFDLLWLWPLEVADVVGNAAAVHWDLLRQDVRYGLRALRRAPGFALSVVLVVGIGVGATTSAFTIADHVLVRPLPFHEPDRLVKLWESPPGYSQMELSPPNYLDWKERARSFEGMAAYSPFSTNLVGQGEPRRLEGVVTSSELLEVLGVSPALGRSFAPEDDDVGAARTVILGFALWQDAFGGDAGVVGRTVLLDGEPHTVLGVMPRGFRFPSREVEYWSALRLDGDTSENASDRDNNWFNVVARLAPGVSLEAAREEMQAIAAQLEREHPVENASTGANVVALQDEVSAQSRLLLLVLAAAAACVLLLACTNLAGVLLARALQRRSELAVRAALGGGRERLVRQLLTESLMLAGAGGAVGVAIAGWAIPSLHRLVPQALPVAELPAIDARVLGLAALVTIATGLGFGVLPAVRAARGSVQGALRDGSRGGVGGRRERLRAALVAFQVGASVALLMTSGLLLRALVRVQSTDPGFETERIVGLRTWLPSPKYDATASRVQFYDRVIEEVRALPGVVEAGYVSFLPMVMGGGIWPVTIEGRPVDAEAPERAALRFATTGYFDAIGIPLLLGRGPQPSDGAESPRAAVVSESFARRYWPDADPIGRRFDLAFQERTVVGVVGDVRTRGLERVAEPQVYLPPAQVPDGGLPFYAPKDLVVRASTDPMALVPAIREIVRAVDPEQPVSDIRPLEDLLAENTAPRRLQASVLGAFAAIALLLATLGLHGLLSLAVSQRRQEIGVRVALGARRADVLAMVAREGALLVLTGMVLGVAGGLVAGRSMRALLAGVATADAAALASSIAIALVISLAGSLLPALRATRVDAAVTIREGS